MPAPPRFALFNTDNLHDDGSNKLSNNQIGQGPNASEIENG
jgi:hypothetical protein